MRLREPGGRLSLRRLRTVVLLGLLFAVAAPAFAGETVITNPRRSSLDKRFDYPLDVLARVLERTREKYGDAEIMPYPERLNRKRALVELEMGNLTVFSAPTRTEWERRVIPVRIPLRKGIMGYRLFLIRAADQQKFANVRSVDDLRKFRLGQGLQWSSAAAMRLQGFTVHGTDDYEGLFQMLMHERFDYFPRSINEVFTELALRTSRYPEMQIERTHALYMPLPYYFFVTPKKPAFAKRLTEGLMAMVADKSLDDVFYSYHRENIERANLNSRQILKLENLDLPPETPLDRAEFWYDPKRPN
jgi:hypothetical protein